MKAAPDFWDDIFSQKQAGFYSRIELPDVNNPLLVRALHHFGDVRGKTLIDLGCGRAATSLYFAARGANVISVDLSSTAIRNLQEYCDANGIKNIKAVHGSAMDIASFGKADFIFGSMILHHLEPFQDFAAGLGSVLGKTGKAFFWENNARSKIMIWFRKNIVGKLWVPKYGDPDEFPLMPSEVDEIRKHCKVTIEYPTLFYFQLISIYLLRGRLSRFFTFLDRYFYRYPAIRQYSYRQYVLIN